MEDQQPNTNHWTASQRFFHPKGMSRTGQALENPFAENFIIPLEAEEVDLFEYEARAEAYQRIEEFVEPVYNQKRPHSSLDYPSLNEFG